MPKTAHTLLGLLTALGLAGCNSERDVNDLLIGASASADGGASESGGDSGGDDGNGDGGDGGGGDGADDGGDDDHGGAGGPKLDVGPEDCDDGDCTGCYPPAHEPCDQDDNSLDHALGLGCDGEYPAELTRSGNTDAVAVAGGVGSTDHWAPVEGEKVLVLGTGLTASLLEPDTTTEYVACSDDLGEEHDMGGALPLPIRTEAVDCESDPTLIGEGDCSGTVGEQFDQGADANDYTEVRIDVTVPENVASLSYSFAFMSTEWPTFVGLSYNDMFVAWLESETWTGNISFDENGSPISVNATFLDLQDESSDLAEFEGTCMSGHASTSWLQSTAPVKPGDEITLIFAIFDMSDSIFDSFVLIDDIDWGCEDGAPETTPAG